MLHVILMILKIIGIIIGILISLLLLVLLSVLFVPVRYRIYGEKYNKIYGNVKLYWLFHILSAYVAFEDSKLIYRVKVMGFTIFDDKENVKKSVKSATESVKASTIDTYEEITIDPDSIIKPVTEAVKRPSEELITEPVTERATKTLLEQVSELEDNTDEEVIFKIQSTSKNSQKKRKRVKFIIKQKINKFTIFFKGIFLKIKLLLIKIRNTIFKLYNKAIETIKFVDDKVTYFNENINTEENRELLKFLFKQLNILIKHIKPKRYKIYIKYGSSEPDITGKILGYISMVNAYFNMKLNIIPVFDDQVFEGEIYLKGRIRVFELVRIAFRTYRNKQFKIVLNKIK